MAPPATAPPASRRALPRPFARSSTDRVLTGVAGGLAAWLRVDAMLVRLALLLLTAAGGAGLVLYGASWLVAADPPAEVPEEQPVRPEATVALVLLTLGLLLLLRDVGWWTGDAVMWPAALAALGSAIIWVRGDDRDRARWTRLATELPVGRPWRRPAARVVLGVALVALGLVAFLASTADLAAFGTLALAVGVSLAGVALILGPGVWRLTSQLGAERRERIRSEARAEMAAHLHDSVLQTLALIQRADSPRRMVSLARRQERELRSWLLDEPEPSAADTLAGAAEDLASRVEELHGVPVDVVVVGDAPLDPPSRALVLACREAATNAAAHSGAERVSVYLERGPDGLSGYVRDRGRGFDPGAVPADRRGIAESIRGRVERHGGTATVTSTPGEGTEVHLQVPLDGQHAGEGR